MRFQYQSRRAGITGKGAGVMADTDVDVASVAGQVVDAVRNDHAGGPTGEVVIEGPDGPLGPSAARAEELPEMFLGLGVHRKHRVSHCGILGFQLGDSPELGVPIRALSPRKSLLNLV